MKKFTLICLFVLLSIVLFSGCAEKKPEVKQYAVEDFFRNPQTASFQISPDGKYISYTAPYKNRMNVFVRELSADSSMRVTESLNRDIFFYGWANEDRIVYIQDTGGDENYRLYAVDKNGENPKELTPFEGVQTRFVDILRDNKDEVLISLNKRNPQIFDVYRLNIVSGDMDMIAENPGNIQSWVTDHDGKLRCAVASDGINQTLLYRKTEKGEFKEVITTNFKETLSPLFFTFDNKNIYAVSNLGRDKAAAVKFDLEKGEEIEEIFSHPDVDVQRLGYSRKRKELTAAFYTTWKRMREPLDEYFKGLYEKLDKKITGYEFRISDHNEDETIFLVVVYSDRNSGEYFIYDSNTDELTSLGKTMPWLNPEDLAEMKPVEYKSRDGLTIHGYLTVPKGSDGKNLPVIVNPHGGPWARDSWGYNPEIQLFANRGYAVFQMNFRGSTGYGREFLESSFGEWGLTMQDDITDGVKWLIDQGTADKDRIAIYGASYGGYAVLSGLTKTPDLYTCGIDYVGVSNLFTFMKSIPPYWKPYLEMMHEMVGNPGNEQDSLRFVQTSPVFHVDKIEVPLFVAQGKNDPRVNINESDQIVEALKKRGVDVQYMVKDNEGHGFANQENRFDFYNAALEFLNKHMK